MNNNEFDFTGLDEELLDRLENDDEIGNRVLAHNATETERMKYELCSDIFRWQKERNIADEKLANRLAISEIRARQIGYCQYDRFSLEELISYAEKLALEENNSSSNKRQ